jgi:hypothetical protein
LRLHILNTLKFSFCLLFFKLNILENMKWYLLLFYFAVLGLEPSFSKIPHRSSNSIF